ncbi:MAG: CDP-alcohol phosphatidyltransferase family protein [Vicinamibacterales bacterium]
MTALTPANQLTLLRMFLIPVFALAVVYGYTGSALVIFIVAGLTDALDGIIARRSGQKTTLGAWLDPLADKLLMATTFVVLTLPLEHLVNRIPLWLTVMVIGRDVGIVATVAVVNLAVGRRTFMPSVFGKAATAAYVCTGAMALLANWTGRASSLVPVLVYTSGALTVISGLHYISRVTKAGDS